VAADTAVSCHPAIHLIQTATSIVLVGKSEAEMMKPEMTAQYRLVTIFAVVDEAVARGDFDTARRWLQYFKGITSRRQPDSLSLRLAVSINQLIDALDESSAPEVRKTLGQCHHLVSSRQRAMGSATAH
jgi:hypothetical protein